MRAQKSSMFLSQRFYVQTTKDDKEQQQMKNLTNLV